MDLGGCLGYRLELASQPYQLFTPSPINFSDSEAAVVQSEIQTLLDKGAIKHVEYTQGEFISTLFLVPKKSGDLRPVINLKPLNFFVQKVHFKMENIGSAICYVSPGDYMISLHLKDAYFSVPVHPLDRKLLRFFWKGQRFEFTCLPFGYSPAPRVFTKILIAATWRSKGIRSSIYIDDILIIASSAKQAATLLAFIRNSLESLGFLVKKSHVTPTTRITYLGLKLTLWQRNFFFPFPRYPESFSLVRICFKTAIQPSERLPMLLDLLFQHSQQ